MLSFSIDSRNKTAQLEILLKGERDPIRFTLEEYELVTEGVETYITVKRVRASREWVDALLEEWVRGKKILVPDRMVTMVRMLV